jgi:hypothetical protein
MEKGVKAAHEYFRKIPNSNIIGRKVKKLTNKMWPKIPLTKECNTEEKIQIQKEVFLLRTGELSNTSLCMPKIFGVVLPLKRVLQNGLHFRSRSRRSVRQGRTMLPKRVRDIIPV